MHSHPVLVARDLVLMRSGRAVTAPLSFAVERGTQTLLLGENGAGKTTLFETILGVLPYEGSLQLRGREVREGNRNMMRIGFVPQHTGDVGVVPVTVEELIASGCRTHNARCELHPGACITADEALEVTGMGNYRHMPLSRLSGGLRQRAYLARALAASAELLLLDEPVAGVDTANKETLYTFLSTIARERHLAVVLATHEVHAHVHKECAVIRLLAQ